MACEHCADGEGGCVYPYTGLAPHVHSIRDGLVEFGSTVLDPRANWPVNFREDPGSPGMGTYTHCLQCGSNEYNIPRDT